MAKLHLKVVTPEQLVLDEEIEMLTVKTTDGEVGILPNHINLMAQLHPGNLKVKKGSGVENFTVGEGFLQVFKNTATVVTDLAVSEKDGKEALQKAQAAQEARRSDFEYADTIASLEKSLKV